MAQKYNFFPRLQSIFPSKMMAVSEIMRNFAHVLCSYLTNLSRLPVR